MSLTPEEVEQQALDEVRTHARATLIGKLAGMRSLAKNMKAEDARAWQSADDDRRRMEGCDMSHTKTGDDDVDVLAGGDVNIYYRDPPKQSPEETTVPPSATREVAPSPPVAGGGSSGLFGKVVKTAAIAALGASGVGLPAAALTYWLTRQSDTPPVVVQPVTPSAGPSFGIGLLPPGGP